MTKFLPLIDNYPYEKFEPPTASALASEIGERMLHVIDSLHVSKTQILMDQLIYIANTTQYPLYDCSNGKPKVSKQLYDFQWLTDDYYEVTDWLIAHTVEKSNNSTFVACVVMTVYWMLTKEDMPLTNFLKRFGLNVTYAKFSVSEYLNYLK